MREDIFGGLKNALDRGEGLEKAVRSFINAGYPEEEVRQVAQALTTGEVSSQQNSQMPSLPKKQTSFPQVAQTPMNQKKQMPVQQVAPPRPKKGKGIDMKLISLSAILLILILVLVVSFFFKDQIIDFFSGLL